MPKKTQHQTEHPFGLKMLQVLAEKGKPNDLAALAEAFGVSVPSTYDWIRHGRFSKERFVQLVLWSNRDLHWWFDIPLDIDPARPDGPFLVQRLPVGANRPPWPFSAISESAICALPAEHKLRLEGAMLAVCEALGLQGKQAAA